MNATNVEFADLSQEAVLSTAHLRRLIDGCLSSYFDSLLDGADSRPAAGDSRTGTNCVPKIEDPSLLTPHRPGPGYISVPGDSRSRSASASNGHKRYNSIKETSSSLDPQSARLADKPLPAWPRASSDYESSSKPDAGPEERKRPGRSESQNGERLSYVFKRLENYIITAFKGTSLLNASFPTHQPSTRSASSGNPPKMKMDQSTMPEPGFDASVFEPDAKTLLLGDLAENSSWWMTEWAKAEGHMSSSGQGNVSHKHRLMSSRSPRINWPEVTQWYQLVLTAGGDWPAKWAAKKPDPASSEAEMARSKRWETIDASAIEREITESRVHLRRTLMKAVENLLKRPRQILRKPEDTRFLFILLVNPVITRRILSGPDSPP